MAKQSKPSRRFWSEVELELLRRNFADSHTRDIAQVVGRTASQVLAKANKLGLRKSLAFIAEVARERALRPEHGGHATRFKKGQPPANKGVKRPDGWAPGNMRSTQFKPGSKPHTWVPVGSYRITADGQLERKTNDEPGPNNVRWKGVHSLVWQAANGPVPEGHVVVFKPGRRTTKLEDITLDAVELLSRAELCRRNSIHTLPPELADVMRLRGQLKRQINKRAKAST